MASTPATLNIRVSDAPQLRRLISAVAALIEQADDEDFGDTFAGHPTYLELRDAALELAHVTGSDNA